MPERAAFLRMICDNPGDDGPRLVYADWLEECGDTARSEFIRLQIERCNLPLLDYAGRQRLTRQCEEQYGISGAAWRTELPALAGVTWGVFRRGFVHSATVSNAETFAQQADALFAAAPVEEVVFTTLGVDGAKLLAGLPHLARVTCLCASNAQLGDEGLGALVGSRHVANLKQLLADRNGFSSEGAEHIARSQHLANLVELFLPGNQIGDSGAQALAAAAGLPNVEEVTLSGNNLNEMGIAALHRRWGGKAYV